MYPFYPAHFAMRSLVIVIYLSLIVAALPVSVRFSRSSDESDVDLQFPDWDRKRAPATEESDVDLQFPDWDRKRAPTTDESEVDLQFPDWDRRAAAPESEVDLQFPDWD
ncbi:hypothetical protein PQX77_020548 [Marasmius sp. AFHP31]|nr:hypothetical protein PQX77_020548 [Marasmius sp. AFHP31]